jgi:hypothetical protein
VRMRPDSRFDRASAVFNWRQAFGSARPITPVL